MLLASDGRQGFSPGAVARAAALAGDGLVAVITIAKVHGTQFGLPNPWLMPTRTELAERREWVAEAIAALEHAGCQADGQVAVTRKPLKKLATVARLRQPTTVVIDETTATGWRRRVEGDLGEDLRRRLRRTAIEVEVVPPAPTL